MVESGEIEKDGAEICINDLIKTAIVSAVSHLWNADEAKKASHVCSNWLWKREFLHDKLFQFHFEIFDNKSTVSHSNAPKCKNGTVPKYLKKFRKGRKIRFFNIWKIRVIVSKDMPSGTGCKISSDNP